MSDLTFKRHSLLNSYNWNGMAVTLYPKKDRPDVNERLLQGGPILPFLKWPGGKRWAANKIAQIVASHLRRTYYEPFVGGGAVFFCLTPQQAVLSDINDDLINTYNVVRTRPHALIRTLQDLKVTKQEYLRQRAMTPEGTFARAVRFLYLNRTAFGGIYRLNQRGEFNVPYGGGERTPAPLWTQGLLKKASKALKRADIETCDFECQLHRAKRGDVFYCDPTYTVAHDNNGFVRYNERNFTWHDQERLADAAVRAVAKGATVIISNAHHRSVRQLYKGWTIVNLDRNSLVSTNPSHRREVQEYLIVCAQVKSDKIVYG